MELIVQSDQDQLSLEYQIPEPPYVLKLEDFTSCLLSHLNLDLPGLARKCEEAYQASPFHLAELWGRIQGLHNLPVDQYYGFVHKMHDQTCIHEMYLHFVAQVGAYSKIKISKALALHGFKLYEKWAYLNFLKTQPKQAERKSTHHYYGSEAYLKAQEEKNAQRKKDRLSVVP